MKKFLNLAIAIFGLVVSSGTMIGVTPIESAIQNNFSTQVGYICSPFFPTSPCSMEDIGLAAYLETQVGTISDEQTCADMYAYLYYFGTTLHNNSGWANNFAEFVLQNYAISIINPSSIINSIQNYISNLKTDATNAAGSLEQLVQEGMNFVHNLI